MEIENLLEKPSEIVENRPATLNERTSVIIWILDNEWLKKEFSPEFKWWDEKLANITYKQKKYINALIFQNNREKLYELIKSITKV